MAEAKAWPPGRIKIADALRVLLETKDFGAITTSEIAKSAGVTEALIYKYFKGKRDLLYQLLSEYLEHYDVQVERDLKGIKGALNKLRKLIWSHINVNQRRYSACFFEAGHPRFYRECVPYESGVRPEDIP